MPGQFNEQDALRAVKLLKVYPKGMTLDQLAKGMNVELEHGTRYKGCNVTDNKLVPTAQIALAHLNESPDYYRALERMEKTLEKKSEEEHTSPSGLSILGALALAGGGAASLGASRHISKQLVRAAESIKQYGGDAGKAALIVSPLPILASMWLNRAKETQEKTAGLSDIFRKALPKVVKKSPAKITDEQAQRILASWRVPSSTGRPSPHGAIKRIRAEGFLG